ncbi:MAG TPA: hypothetical protein VHB50_16225 [Bryobacteraceae bacterium]|nr:hypothetical protein [Bryobacteraceae bacterium]
MLFPQSARPGNHLGRLALLLVVLTFILADTVIVAWYAMVLSSAELTAGVAAWLLLSAGALYTLWEMDR